MNWAIVGTGYIANRFADGFKYVPDARLRCVMSRSFERGKAFADKFGVAKVYARYEDILRDTEIDIVYIGTPNRDHYDQAKLFLNAGFHVLCEKPMCANPAETRELIRIAKENDRFLMEGMWTRFFPAVRKAKAWLESGAIGDVRMLSANFSIDSSQNMNQWRFDYDMAGGSLMDVGIYGIAIALYMLGHEIESVDGIVNVQNKVDMYESVMIKFKGGSIAMLGSGLAAKMDNKVVISGSKGNIVIGEGYDWWRANRAEWIATGDDDFTCNGKRRLFEEPYPSLGFQYEIQAVEEYLRHGLRESTEIPLEETLLISEIMYKLLKSWGIEYRDSLRTRDGN